MEINEIRNMATIKNIGTKDLIIGEYIPTGNITGGCINGNNRVTYLLSGTSPKYRLYKIKSQNLQGTTRVCAY
jgi:hypothetical protein